MRGRAPFPAKFQRFSVALSLLLLPTQPSGRHPRAGTRAAAGGATPPEVKERGWFPWAASPATVRATPQPLGFLSRASIDQKRLITPPCVPRSLPAQVAESPPAVEAH